MTYISIFTPTYNRCKLLNNCYQSLLMQTNKDFVWIIVDDGSTDDTSSKVKMWQEENILNIHYIKQDNQGKHIAHNTAVMHCTTKYMLIFDSDDLLDPRCVEVLTQNLLLINNKNDVSGIIGNKQNISRNSSPGDKLPAHIDYATGVELYQKYNVIGDTLRLYKTNILRKYLFPQIEGEKFIYENVVFDAIDEKYTMLIIHDILYYYEYLDDGYTANSSKIKVNNPIGYSLSLNSSVAHSVSKKKRINWTILYIIWCKHFKIKNCYKNFSKKFLYVLLYPLALILYIFKKPFFFFEIIEYKGINNANQ